MASRSLVGFAILGCASVLLPPAAIARQTTQESAVLAAVQSLLDGWREADSSCTRWVPIGKSSILRIRIPTTVHEDLLSVMVVG